MPGQTPHLNESRKTAARGPQALLQLSVDMLKLFDLQIQLVSLDVREFWSAARWSLALFAIAIASVLAALPVLMMGLAEILRQDYGWSLEWALLTIAGAVLLSAVGALVWSAMRLSRAAAPLQRSTEELQANLTWMRSVLHDESAEWKSGT